MLERLARELVVEDKVATAAVVAASVWAKGRWTGEIGAFGHLAAGDGRTVTPTTWFDLASVTKPITALAAARLARAHRLDLRAPLGTYLPEARETPSAGVSLELLLAHRAGLDAHRSLFRSLLRGQIPRPRDGLVEAANARRVDALGEPPAEGFAPVYSDLGYLLVGEALARVAGSDLDVVLDREVLRPLKMQAGSARQLLARDAHFGRTVAATEVAPWRGGLVRGLVHDENAWAQAGEGTAGHAGLFGTAEGVLRLGQAVVDALHGRIDEFLTREEMHTLVRERPLGTLRAGFDGKSAVGSSSGTAFGKSTVGHLGFTGTSVWCDVEREMVGVLLTNRVHPTRESDVIRRVRPRAYDRIAAWVEMRRGS